MGEMSAAGLQPRIDPAGNIFARRPVTAAAADPVRLAHRLGSERRQLRRRSRFALRPRRHRNAAGGRRPHAASARNGGLGARRGLRVRPWPRVQPDRRRRRHAGGHGRGLERHAPRRGDPARSAAIRIGFSRRAAPKGSHHCYLELHIEQGGTLERARHPGRRRRRDRRDRPVRRDDHRLRQPRRHDADCRAARRDAGGVAPDDGGPRRATRMPGGRSVRSATSR